MRPFNVIMVERLMWSLPTFSLTVSGERLAVFSRHCGFSTISMA